MLGFRRPTCPQVSEQCPIASRVAATWMVVGASKPTRRPCRQRSFRRSQRLEAKTRPAGSERWSWPAREPRPNPLDTRRPIQGLLRLHSRALERERRAAREALHWAIIRRDDEG